MRCTCRLWILLSVLMMGCAGTAPTHFYVMTALPHSERIPALPGDKRNLAIGVGPVELPAYLDRPQIVTRLGATTLDLSEFHRWAEPLKDNIPRILAENLSNLLATDYIATYPWPRSTSIAYQVRVDLIHFEGTFGEQSVLKARWYILDAKRDQELMRSTSNISVPAETTDYATMVTAMSQTLETLSRDIAVALRALAQNPATG